ncbi:5-formyltetrahydrofolate cyclo-ligase [Ectobacillus ponti]|uniref:5-formyltetrahydrofolate cyclo-ligase n=1 Tax=Ectobacillus ponti TaxID=2961894 RepID=A0AA41X5A9_9BACI|nr:5-formyltetrahydrofolate cyclo-ligase [Ectobacillus ponti]MCP8967130.1 5-formyltetrahydrofolate cyclo-ligase [Ectobacillus ponti]
MMNEKKRMREEIAARLAALSKEARDAGSRRIAAKLYETEAWKQARTIGITISIDQEVDTYEIIRTAWKEGKRVAVPKCDRRTRTMTFRSIRDLSQLEIVYMNLREPIPSVTEAVDPAELDLLIVPGVAFTKTGGRLGYGGGYYDRFLAEYQGITAALAFSAQLMPAVPTEPHDQSVDLVLTEQ